MPNERTHAFPQKRQSRVESAPSCNQVVNIVLDAMLVTFFTETDQDRALVLKARGKFMVAEIADPQVDHTGYTIGSGIDPRLFCR